MKQSLYDAVGGHDAVTALALAWHRRCLADPLASHPFSHPDLHPQHIERLAAYWAEAWGGPAAYTATMGDESRVQRMHAGNGDHPDLDQRCMELFGLALADAGIPVDLRTSLQHYFADAVERMAHHPQSAAEVPAGLPLPHWPQDA